MSSENKVEVLKRLTNIAEDLNLQVLEVQSVIAAIRKQLTDEMFAMSVSSHQVAMEVHPTLVEEAESVNTQEITKVEQEPNVLVLEPNPGLTLSVPTATNDETAEIPLPTETPWLNPRQLRRKLRAEAAKKNAKLLEEGQQKLEEAQQIAENAEPEPLLLGDPIVELQEPLLLTDPQVLELGEPIAKKTAAKKAASKKA